MQITAVAVLSEASIQRAVVPLAADEYARLEGTIHPLRGPNDGTTGTSSTGRASFPAGGHVASPAITISV